MPLFQLSPVIALVGMMLYGNTIIWGVLIGSLLSSFFIFQFPTPLLALINGIVMGMGMSLQAIIGRYIYRKFCHHAHPFTSLPNLFFLILAIITACHISSAFMTSLYFLNHSIELSDIAKVWIKLWLSDFIGSLIFVSTVLAWYYELYKPEISKGSKG